MLENDLISIIVPAYNVEQYLKRCIDSICNQTYSNIEIILIDDGSTDRTGSICDQYSLSDSRIKVIHKTNGGLSDARNVGIDIASGEYLMFVDSDDWISYDMVEILLSFTRHNALKLSVCECVYAYDNKLCDRNLSGSSFILSKDQALKMLVKDRRFRTNAWNKIYHRSLWESIRFPVGKKYEDVYIMHEIYDMCENIGFIDEGLYFYFQRSNSIVHQACLDSFDNLIDGTVNRFNYLHTKYEEMLPELSAAVVTSVLVTYRNIGISKIDYTKEDIKRYENIIKKFKNKRMYIYLSPRTKIEWILYLISPFALIKTSKVIERIYHTIKEN